MHQNPYRISWWKIVAILVVVAVLFIHPLTRRIMWFILPLGFKPDDLVFIGAGLALIALIIAVIRGVVNHNTIVRIIASLFLVEERKKNEWED